MTNTAVISFVFIGILILIIGILRLRKASVQDMIIALIGAVFGLLIGALVSVPIGRLPAPWGGILPLVVTAVITVTLMGVVLSRRAAIIGLLPR